MLRLDKYLCDVHIGSRSQVKEYLKQGLVRVDGVTVKRPETKVDETEALITFRGKTCNYSRYKYYMLNKPAGTVSATKDNTCETVTALLKGTGETDLFPVGRLDKDTEGLLLLTNDGELAHMLLAPGRHVEKVYYVVLEQSLTTEAVRLLKEGVDIGERNLTLPAEISFVNETCIYLTITEGKFHQVKRMMQAAGNRVLYLKRVAMGSLRLDETLETGKYRELTQEEISALKTTAGIV